MSRHSVPGDFRRAAWRFLRGADLALVTGGVTSTMIGFAIWFTHGGPKLATYWPAAVPLFVGGMVVLTLGAVRGALRTRTEQALHDAEVSRRLAGELAVLQAASARLSRETAVEAVGRAIVEETGRIVDYDNARVYQLELNGDLVPIACEGRAGEYDKVDLPVLRTRIGVGFTGWVAEHGSALIVDDANADPRGVTIPGTDEVDESMLVVPMRYDERTVGVVTLSKLGLRAFDADDLRLLATLADQGATALESARLLTRTQALALELRQLLDMGSELSTSLDPRQVGEIIARHMAVALGADRCVIGDWDARRGDGVRTLGSFPPAPAGPDRPSFHACESDVRRVIERQETVVLSLDQAGAVAERDTDACPSGSGSVAILPLVARGRPVGLVELASRQAACFGGAQLQLAKTMATEAAMALENARLYEDARALADRDPLTGFFNHRYLHERLGEELLRAQRTRQPVSLLMIDLDDFKLVNDTFGHLLGDRVLLFVAELIRSTLRVSDVPARYGGDEFAVILPAADQDGARHAADRILDALRTTPLEADGRGPLPMAASIGIATHPGDGRTVAELIAAADAGLYRVKGAGGLGAVAVGLEEVLSAAI